MRIIYPVTVSALCWCVVAFTASADVVVTKTKRYEGEIQRIDARGVAFVLKEGAITFGLNEIVEIQMNKPAAVDQGIALLTQKKYEDAINLLQPVVERYGSVRVPGLAWMSDVILHLGDSYVGMKKYPEAQRIYDAYARAYGSPKEMVVKQARLQVAQDDCAKATDLLAGFIEPLLKEEWLSDAQEAALAEALVLRGDCLHKSSETSKALDSYLLVVTLFDVDRNRRLEAQIKAGEMFAQLGNPKRARGYFQDVVQDAPDSGYAEDARKQLAALKP